MLKNEVRELRAVSEDMVPPALRDWRPLPMRARAMTMPSEGIERPRLRSRNRCRAIESVRPVEVAAPRSAVVPAPETVRSVMPTPAVARVSVLDNPIVVGLALVAMPPVGVSILWASSRYSTAGKIAMTVFAGFTMLVAASLSAAIYFASRGF